MRIKQSRMMVCGLALMLLLGGCGNVYAGSGTGARQNGQRDRSESSSREREETESEEAESSREEREETEGEETGSSRRESGESEESDSKKARQVSFGSVPYFRDDSGSNTQLADGWIYGYWSRQLCRVNADTLESEVLFEADSPQAGFFSIYDGMIYFLEQKNISYPEGKKANLWRMECDGSGQELIAEEFDMPDGIMAGMEIYDDILYLLSRYADQEGNRYFRLKTDGSIEQISEAETLFGIVPVGWQDARMDYRFANLPNFVYCVRNYGYGFLCDEADDLYRVIPETEETERIPLYDVESSANCLMLTNEALVYRDFYDTWYSADLDDLREITELGEMDCYDIAFWDEKGIYNIERTYGDSSFSMERLNWNGKKETLDYGVTNPRLTNSVYGDYLSVLYSDGTYLYYDGLSGGDGAIFRTPLEKGAESYLESYEEAEQVFVYYDNPVMEISTRETFATTFTVEETGDKGEFSVTRVYLTEDTEAAAKINALLEEIYRSEEEYIDELMDDVREMAFSDWDYGWDMTLVEDSLSASISYLDEDYIGISFFWYEYWSGAAHGQHGNVEYVFSRSSGEQILLTDIVENSEEEICAIIAPYVEAEAEWGTDEEGWERIILDEGRFYMTAEGIGIHFDTYELTCYASGGLDVVVPYELFDMRNPKEVGLTSF